MEYVVDYLYYNKNVIEAISINFDKVLVNIWLNTKYHT